MNKADNMKQAMHEMFGVGKGAESKAAPAAAAAKGTAPAAKPAETTVRVAQAVPVARKPEPVASLLAEGTSFEGTLNAKGDVEIAGEFKGNIATEGAVRLRSSIQSGISAKSVELFGCVLTGDVTASGTVAVSENSKIIGNVTAKELLCAGEVAGDLKVSESVRLDEKARVSGNIVTGAISVEKGAAISGNVQIRALSEEKV